VAKKIVRRTRKAVVERRLAKKRMLLCQTFFKAEMAFFDLSRRQRFDFDDFLKENNLTENPQSIFYQVRLIYHNYELEDKGQFRCYALFGEEEVAILRKARRFLALMDKAHKEGVI